MSAKLSPVDLAELAASADIRTRRGYFRADDRKPIPVAAWVVLGITAMSLAYYVSNNAVTTRKITDPDSENFSTTSPIPPTIPPEQVTAPDEPGKYVVVKPDIAPPPPIAEPATPTNLETPPPITPPSAAPMEAPEAAALDEPVEDNSAALAAEAERLARLKSPLIVFDNGEDGKKQLSVIAPEAIAPSLQQAEQAELPVAQ